MQSDVIIGQQPRYIRVANEIAGDISSGAVQPGELLPPEGQLVERFQVSRATVREALKRLSSLGLVTTEHGVGTRVMSQEIKTHYTVSMRSLADVAQYGGIATQFEALSRETVVSGPQSKPVLGAISGRKWEKMVGRRSVADQDHGLIAYSEIYVRHPYNVIIEEGPVYNVAFYNRIAAYTHQPIIRIEQEIEALALNAEQAGMFGQKAGDPGMIIVRRYFSVENEPVEVTVSVYPAGMFAYKLYLQLEKI